MSNERKFDLKWAFHKLLSWILLTVRYIKKRIKRIEKSGELWRLYKVLGIVIIFFFLFSGQSLLENCRTSCSLPAIQVFTPLNRGALNFDNIYSGEAFWISYQFNFICKELLFKGRPNHSRNSNLVKERIWWSISEAQSFKISNFHTFYLKLVKRLSFLYLVTEARRLLLTLVKHCLVSQLSVFIGIFSIVSTMFICSLLIMCTIFWTVAKWTPGCVDRFVATDTIFH